VTDAQGVCVFTDLKKGTYTLTEDTYPGWATPAPIPFTVDAGTESGGSGGHDDCDDDDCDSEESPTYGYVAEVPNVKLATVTIVKYNDVNGDDAFNVGVDSYLDRDFELVGPGGHTDVGSTGDDGMLEFADLVPGAYTLTETVPDGWHADPKSWSFTLDPGDVEEITAYNTQYGDLLVKKFNDRDGDGQRDDGPDLVEPWIDWDFTLTGSDAKGDIASRNGSTAGADGLPFGDLMPGTYSLSEGSSAGWYQSTDVLGEDFAIDAGQSKTIEVGNTEYARVEVFKFNDLDDDGEQDDGESPLGGISFTLTNEPGTPTYSVTDHTEHGGTEVGTLAFTGLKPGTYKLTENLSGWFVKPDMPLIITLLGGDVFRQTVCNTQYGTIVVKKFNDLDGDTVKDAGEEWIAQEFTLDGTDISGPISAKTGTTSGGVGYEFTGLRPGTYQLTEVLAAGWSQSTDVLGKDIVLAAGETTTVVVGNWMPILPFTDPDLGIHKSANKSVVVPGQEVVYTLTYFNIGESNATDFVIVDDYDETKMDVVDAAGGTVSGGKITWNIAGPLAHDASAVITYTLRAKTGLTTGTVIDNSATISITDLRDPTADDNFDTVRITVGDEPYSPYTEEEDSLPFTGADVTLLLLAAAALALAGALIRRSANRAVA
jgi:uncharacterized surface anchored protein